MVKQYYSYAVLKFMLNLWEYVDLTIQHLILWELVLYYKVPLIKAFSFQHEGSEEVK